RLLGGRGRVRPLVRAAGLDEGADLAAGRQAGQVGESQARPTGTTVARARPRTLVPPDWAVRSTRAVPAVSSIAPTTAVTSSVTEPIAGTSIGLVNRTE